MKRNHFQCYHNNRGYCRFADECHFQHYSETCQKRVCKDRECAFRHPKPCRNRENCKFFKLEICFYKHEDDIKEENNDKEVINNKVKECEDQIKTLEAEILDLKNNVKSKEMELETKIAYESGQSSKVRELMKKNDIQISDLK